MSSAAWREAVKTAAPEYGATSDATLDFRIDTALTLVDAVVFEDAYVPAVAYLAAHFLTLDLRASGGVSGSGVGQATAGPITSAQTVRLSVSYGQTGGSAFAAKTMTDAALMTTPYGLHFMMLRDSRAGITAPWVPT